MVRSSICGVVAAVTLLGVAGGSGAPVPSSPDPGSVRTLSAAKPETSEGPGTLSQEDLDAQIAQQPYFVLADEVFAINRAQTRRGLGGLLLDQPGHAVTVYWVGAIPEALRALQIRRRDQKVRLRILPARSTERELAHAATLLGNLNEHQHLGISVIDIASDGSGLTVRAPELGRAASGRVRPTRQQAALIAAARGVTRSTGVAIRLADTRTADRATSTGGALI